MNEWNTAEEAVTDILKLLLRGPARREVKRRARADDSKLRAGYEGNAA